MTPRPHIIAHMDLNMAEYLHIITHMDLDMAPCLHIIGQMDMYMAPWIWILSLTWIWIWLHVHICVTLNLLSLTSKHGSGYGPMFDVETLHIHFVRICKISLFHCTTPILLIH